MRKHDSLIMVYMLPPITFLYSSSEVVKSFLFEKVWLIDCVCCALFISYIFKIDQAVVHLLHACSLFKRIYFYKL